MIDGDAFESCARLRAARWIAPSSRSTDDVDRCFSATRVGLCIDCSARPVNSINIFFLSGSQRRPSGLVEACLAFCSTRVRACMRRCFAPCGATCLLTVRGSCTQDLHVNQATHGGWLSEAPAPLPARLCIAWSHGRVPRDSSYFI